MKKEFDITVSFCVPVYNVEGYIEACISSIIAEVQNTCNYEIICVDDNSTDNSYAIICELAKKFPNITVYKNQANEGISYTRNRLIDLSRGEYIWFVDSDDMLYSGALKRLLWVAKKTTGDIILANYIKISQDDFKLERESSDESKYKVITAFDLDWLPDENGECRMMSSWRGIISKSYLETSGIRYTPSVIFKEDALLYYQLLLKKPKWVKCEFPCYCVRQRSGSAMRGGFKKRAKTRYFSGLSLVDELCVIQAQNPTISKAFINEKRELLRLLSDISDISFVSKQYDILKEKGYIENDFSLNNKCAFMVKYVFKRIAGMCKSVIFSILNLFKKNT